MLIPYSILLGALTLLLADTVGRTVAAPYEISASIIMSVIGGPFFICCSGGQSMVRSIISPMRSRTSSFAYGKHEVIKHLSFDLHEGKITTLIGANGCGKSTLFNLMTKNLTPGSGSIALHGRSLAEIRLKELAKQAAIVHQYNTAPADLSVEKLIAYGRTPYHTLGLSPDAEEDEEKVRWADGDYPYAEAQE